MAYINIEISLVDVCSYRYFLTKGLFLTRRIINKNLPYKIQARVWTIN
jgi:hypothetical protein